MSPEERARIALGKIYFQESKLDCHVQAVAAAIREAVEAEREACAAIARQYRDSYIEGDTERAAAGWILEDIEKRGKT